MKARFQLRKLGLLRRLSNQNFIRDACQNAYLGDHIALARVLGRYKMFLDTRDVAFAPHMLTDGYWEMAHTEVMARLVKKGMKAVDLGANLGYFTLIMAERVGASGAVHAFEPNPHIAKLLRDTVEINSFARRTVVHEIALSNANGEIDFFIDPSRPMNATVHPRPGHEEVKVPTARFDEIADLEDCDFVKIDVEGAEEAVWAGMDKRIANPRPLTVILEFTPGRYGDAGAFIDTFEHQGFSLSYIHRWRGIVATSKSEILAKPGDVDQLLVLQR
ncbi:FkbM family methyltransferase [Erythrobacter sp. SCSIO 43205]|uniref:FkbM family methyltransferase n=1 Tax=Erythrobacter sp. SCSIO 43205 TaxID=2779361 RepID=UPI001CA9412A|nr:FkbM family methyltransferase [Erythrobacter sp. SCSIO 43205]UAB78656.1 FkbM family methyltransferase [Erythrobacter sp. SCSIO 43205]